MTFRLIETSLEFDPIIRDFATRAEAIAKGVELLAAEGWPREIARKSLEDGESCLVADDGDDWVIRLA